MISPSTSSPVGTDSPAPRPATGPVSVVMPAYNEEGAIEAAVRDVAGLILDRMPGSELVVIDDGSRDGTGAILDRLAAEDPRVRVVHQPNGGHGAALRRGMEQAGGDYLLLIDSDRQIPIESFDPLWRAAQGRDAAIGVRAQRHDPPFRLWLTRQIRRSLRLLFGVSLRDANVPFKVVRRSAWQAARPYIPEGTLAPSLFLAVFLKAKGMDVVEVEVPHLERQTGVASIRRWKLLKFCGRAFRQLLAFRRRLRAS